jgi:Fe-S cluster assembly iron-binding protein IscA
MALFSRGGTSERQIDLQEKCRILGQLWLNYPEEAEANEEWTHFFDCNDVGLPLAYMVAEALVDGVSDEGAAVLEETWDDFVTALAHDPNGYHEIIGNAFEGSSDPSLQASEKRSSSPKVDTAQGLDGHGLEGFMGRRTEAPVTKSRYLDGVPMDEGLTLVITKSDWRTIGDACLRSGREGAHLRLHVLPCTCGGYHEGISFDTYYNVNDLAVSNGSATVVADRDSAKYLHKARLEADESAPRIRGVPPIRLKTSGFIRCQCGDSWQPIAGVAAMAAAFGFVKRNVAIAHEWNTGSSGSFDPSDAISAVADYLEQEESDSSDHDFDFDLGGF